MNGSSDLNLFAFLIQLLVTAGITGWVYKVLKTSFGNTIDDLRKQIEALKLEIEKLKESENKWYKKYHKLLLVYEKNYCKSKDCKVHNEVQKHLSEEGEL